MGNRLGRKGRWPGTWRAICDRCGFELPSNLLIKDWQGLRVCKECWEPRHPQDFVRGVPDCQTPPWTRPEPPDIFVELLCDMWSSASLADFGVADCAKADSEVTVEQLIDIFNPVAIAGIAVTGRSIAGVI